MVCLLALHPLSPERWNEVVHDVEDNRVRLARSLPDRAPDLLDDPAVVLSREGQDDSIEHGDVDRLVG